MTAREIELRLVTRMFPYWKWIVVPRTYQIVGYECDLLALTEAGYAHEVEIKVSLSDVKADLKKDHGHLSERVKCFWFAMPADLVVRAEAFIPARAGILAVREHGYSGEIIRIHRKPQVNRGALPWPWPERCRLARAVMIRYWSESVREMHRTAELEEVLR